MATLSNGAASLQLFALVPHFHYLGPEFDSELFRGRGIPSRQSELDSITDPHNFFYPEIDNQWLRSRRRCRFRFDTRVKGTGCYNMNLYVLQDAGKFKG